MPLVARAICPSATFRDEPTVDGDVPRYGTGSGISSDNGAFTRIGKDEASKIVKSVYKYPSADSRRVQCPFMEPGLKLWHDPSTWPDGLVPGPGENITLARNARILVSSCSFDPSKVYGKIVVSSGSVLVFDDAPIKLNVLGIVVQGKLSIGSSSCRLRSKIRIILHGKRTERDLGGWYKGIHVVQKGVLDIHGAHFSPTWTRLSRPAKPGDTLIHLQDNVNWDVGSSVVLVGTELKDARDWHRNEVVVIKNVFNLAIELAEPLKYPHAAIRNAYQGEVGLLSRRVVVQGDPASRPRDTSPRVCKSSIHSSYPCEQSYLTGFGGHILIDGTTAIGRLEGVQLDKMGQTNRLGRYPFHLHLLGHAGSKSYIRDSSVTESYYRCVVIHGTHDARVMDNVAFDAIGHCFYLEDGIEENNTFAGNLAAHIHMIGKPPYSGSQMMDDVLETPVLLNPADITASGFYIPNAYNRFIGNTACGGFTGFAFVRVDSPLKSSRDYEGLVFPSRRRTLEFDGNICHSSGHWWHQAGCIYVGGTLRHQSPSSDLLVYNAGRDLTGRDTDCYLNSVNCDGVLQFTNTKVFLSGWGLNHWGKRSDIIGYESHDNTRSMSLLGMHFVSNMFVDCWTGYTPEQPTNQEIYAYPSWLETRWFTEKHVGFEFYDTMQKHIIQNAVFRNCANSKSITWQLLDHSDTFVPELMQATRGIRYEPGDAVIIKGSKANAGTVATRLQNWLDLDGSASLRFKPSLIGSAHETAGLWWRVGDCDLIQEGRLWACDLQNKNNVHGRTTRGIGSLFIEHNPPLQDQVGKTICGNGQGLPCPRIGEVAHFGQNQPGMTITAQTKITGPVNGIGWYFNLDGGSPKMAKIKQIQVANQDVMVLIIPYPPTTKFDITYHAAYWCNEACSSQSQQCTHKFTEVHTLQQLYKAALDGYHFDGKHLYLRIVQQSDDSLDFTYSRTTPIFTRANIQLPVISPYAHIVLKASQCGGNDPYACEKTNFKQDDVCQNLGKGKQVSYDTCSA
eukprot:CAMPEP_0203756312 /NCGR_PEP_ID=MMETSP0098-20131031/9613_1 /ASSEMBLY_ACC=CAM_ASM_000208 /TAXON_ID=96639 /ORGANISM=" , Strain NY0313808BC1" /LENGTH=1013 /DNA_ID=CAMNT_0050648141 /DNA_START=114 /DNA_END=3155 /DNA_ORIENTATION=+